jgi:prolyl-tRNA synthetase
MSKNEQERSQEGITVSKKENFDEWYTQVIIKGEIADYTPVSGCLAFRPVGYGIWENIQKAVDKEFKKVGIQNVYFPLFIPERLLRKEQEHVEGFSPEVAWVTHAGRSELDEKLAVRPTSETIMYEVISRWIRSWRDLPLRLNQWNNVVRWEFKHPTPFLRSREFLWNEGHSIFATKEEAEAERDEILTIYRKITEEYLALPGIIGRKTDTEKFAGAEASYSIEHLLPDGKAIQGPDFHFDGQRFSKAFEIAFIDKDGQRKYAWQNTWAISTREIGVMIAVHGDDKGAIIPPMVAPIQIVIVPIYSEENKDIVLENCEGVSSSLSRYRIKLDKREHLTPGRKFYEWELRGVPLRIEIGIREAKNGTAVLARRDTGGRREVKQADIEFEVENELAEIQKNLFMRAKKFLDENTQYVSELSLLKSIIAKRGGIVRGEWCGSEECEKKIKEETGAKIINISLDENPKGICIICNKKAKYVANIARSY